MTSFVEAFDNYGWGIRSGDPRASDADLVRARDIAVTLEQDNAALTAQIGRMDRALDAVEAEVGRLREQRDATLKLHPPIPYPRRQVKICESCAVHYPCPTATALGVTQ